MMLSKISEGSSSSLRRICSVFVGDLVLVVCVCAIFKRVYKYLVILKIPINDVNSATMTTTVVFENRVLRLKSNPNKQIGELLKQSCTHFQVDSQRYSLFYNSTKLSPGLPLRLANLPNGVKLLLEPSGNVVEDTVLLKLQFVGAHFAAVVHKFQRTTTLEELMKVVEDKIGKRLLGEGYGIKIQIFTRVIVEGDFGLTLADVGVENNGVLRISFTKTVTDEKVEAKSVEVNRSSPKSSGTVDINTQSEVADVTTSTGHACVSAKSSKDQTDTTDHEMATNIEPKHLYVYRPSTIPIAHIEASDEDYELTVSHAQQYQNILAKQAHETTKQRQARLQDAHRNKKLQNIEIRIKFPDNTVLQTNFKADESTGVLYDSVASFLNGNTDFHLSFTYPPKVIVRDDGCLLKDVFESRNLILFNCNTKGDTWSLKQEYLNRAVAFNEAEEIKKERTNSYTTPDEKISQFPQTSEALKVATNPPNKAVNGKKVPKWLKLGKK